MVCSQFVSFFPTTHLFFSRTKKSTMSSGHTEGGKPSEAESMLASALLDFRSDYVTNKTTYATMSTVSAPRTKKAALGPKKTRATPPRATQNNQVGTEVDPYVMNQVFGHSQQALSQQLAAIQAAKTAGPVSYVVATASNQRLQYNLYQMIRSGNPPMAPIHGVGPMHHHSAFAGTKHSRTDISMNVGTENDWSAKVPSAPDNLVRRQEIDAALRSKPQRGRKRDNLSEVERLELTRTRNREHAKSTRNRKKARHQEMLDNEIKLNGYLKTEKLNEKRRRCVLDFFSIRERMLRSTRPSNQSAGSDETTQIVNTGAESKALQDVVEDMATFTFCSRTETSDATTAMSCMQNFDMRLTFRLSSLVGKSVLSSLSYEVMGFADGIALTSGDTGIAEVKLVSSIDSFQPLLTGVLHFQFAPQLDKLRSVVWSTTSDALDERSAKRLDAQFSHPSVVSLDPFATSSSTGTRGGDRNRGQDRHGPGMNI
jgi:hypothetical protein